MKKFLFFLLLFPSVVVRVESQTRISLQIDASNVVDYVVTDPAGRQSGIDPRVIDQSGQPVQLNNIPNSGYSYMSVGNSALNGNWSVSSEFTAGFLSPQGEGVYRIDLIGDTLAAFNIYLTLASYDTTLAQDAQFSTFKVPIDKDSVVTYLFTYHEAPGSAVSFTKVVSATSLIQDVTVMRKLGWIKDQETANKYLDYFNSAKSQLQSNNLSGARATLQTVLSNAIADSVNNLTHDAYALLSSDTDNLLSQLPLPLSGLNVKLVNSLGTKLTGGALQYYDGSWKPAVNNNDGTFTVNTTLKTVSLQMTYAYGVQTKSNVTVGSDTVVFQTVNAQVKLQNSQGSLMDTGTVQYYAGAWRNFGTTSNGVATMELLPVNYSFSMTYAFASNNKAQDLSANPIVVFQTTNTSVQLKNSQGNLMDTGTVQYYSGAWRAFGTTTNGTATKELLPNSYSFSMTYALCQQQQTAGYRRESYCRISDS